MRINNRLLFGIFLIVLTVFRFSITPVYAENEQGVTGSKSGEISTNINNCNDDSLLGNPTDEESVAWLLQQILNILKIVGPVIVVVLSSIEFVPIILSGDDKEMAKMQKKVITRLILAVLLFFLPYLVSWLLNIFHITGGLCGLE